LTVCLDNYVKFPSGGDESFQAMRPRNKLWKTKK
jgi:hypothetical protein